MVKIIILFGQTIFIDKAKDNLKFIYLFTYLFIYCGDAF